MDAALRPVVPYGAWPSPISPHMAAAGGTRLSDLTVSGASLWWLESRPTEAGRVVAVKRGEDGSVVEVTPPGWSVRTLVHEYGGGAYVVDAETVIFSNHADQRLWRQEPGGDPVPITPEPASPRSVRYADGCVTPDGRWVICVRQRHASPGVANQIVAVPSDGRGEQVVVVTGPDFVAAPRLSPDGRRLAWLAWDHPNMPWESTSLWVASWSSDARIGPAELVTGGGGHPPESVLQPTWSRPGDELYFVSDRTGWWSVWRWGDTAPLLDAPAGPPWALEAEMARPPWALGLSDLATMPDGRLACRWSKAGQDHLALLDPDTGELALLTPISAQPLHHPPATPTPPPVLSGGLAAPAGVPAASPTTLGDIRALGNRVACLAGSATSGTAVVVVDRPGLAGSTVEEVRPPGDPGLDPSWAPVAQPLEVPTDAGTVRGLYWPPTNPEVVAPYQERPPLLVICHGGPTGATPAGFDVRLAYWTSRGFAVAGVDYRGSTGYGREYRQALSGQWGIADVADCLAVTLHLADAGLADRDRLVVRGASAGGLTALGALASGAVFAAGVSQYGVLDLESLADTHKFESRYLDGLVGPLPASRAAYVKRSPIHRLDGLRAPVLLFHGSQDPIVPPAQAERMASVLREAGVPFAHVVFDARAMDGARPRPSAGPWSWSCRSTRRRWGSTRQIGASRSTSNTGASGRESAAVTRR